MTDNQAEIKRLTEELENLNIKRDMIKQAFTAEDDFPVIKRGYTYTRGNRF